VTNQVYDAPDTEFKRKKVGTKKTWKKQTEPAEWEVTVTTGGGRTLEFEVPKLESRCSAVL
jgi:hypothetical protein